VTLGVAQMTVWSGILGVLTAVVGAVAARTRRQASAALTMGVVVAAYFATELASFGFQARLVGPGHYPWLGKALGTLAVLGIAAARVGVSFASLGLTRAPAPRPLWPVLAGVAACVLASFADPSIPGDPHAPECVAFEATMPGLDEELFFRGLLLAALGSAFPARWTLWGARVGWGHAVSVAVFVLGHLVSVDGALHPHVATDVLPAASLLGFALACTFVRARSGSVWWAVATHNAANSFLVAVAWVR
jgi:hypothetical protein